MSKRLANKVAVITGGSSGIGLATAKKFVAEGAYVFITGRRQFELDKAKAEIGSNVTSIQSDISKIEDLEKLYAIVKSEKGKIDIIVANAGIIELAPTATVTTEHYDSIFNINTRGTFFTVQKALPILNDGGSIVLVSSVAKDTGSLQTAIYSASKAAIRSFVRNWTTELKDKHIRANCISPGPTDTPIIDGNSSKEEADGLKAYFSSVIPMGRLGKAEEIANAILFFASDDSSFITGTDLAVDGGLTQV